MVPLSKSVLVEEIDLAVRILTKWHKAVTEGMPDVDMPATEEQAARFYIELCGELQLVAGKLDNVAALLSSQGYGTGG